MDGFNLPAGLEWLEADPRAARILLERELVRRGGLRAFVELAWHIVEPATPFTPNWHIDLLCEELEDVLEGRNRRLAVAMPPRCSKSLVAAVMFPAYAWITRPELRMMFVTYDFSLSIRDSEKTAMILTSDWYRERWGHAFRVTSDTKIKIQNDRTGVRECRSVGGRVMGSGADIIVMDDPHDVRDVESEARRQEVLNFWRERLQSRLNDARTGAIVVIHQRVHQQDVIGDILTRQAKEYRYICLPMRFEADNPYRCPEDPRTIDGELLWPARIPEPILERLEQNLGTYACTPAESPILMADLSVKPISEVRIGDDVIGIEVDTENGKKKRYTRKSTVLRTYKYFGPVVKLTFESGRTARCTPDHQWYVGLNAGDSGYVRKDGSRHIKPLYRSAVVGRSLCRVAYPGSEIVPPHLVKEAAWFGGFFDGEGSVSLCYKKDRAYKASSLISVSQGTGRNLQICERLERALAALEIDYGIFERDLGTHCVRSYSFKGNGIVLAQKMLHWCEVNKWRDRLIDGALGRMFVKEKEKIVSIEPDGEEDVFALETETGNYVVWGLASSNSAAQYQQRPVPREGGIFKHSWFEIVDPSVVPTDCTWCRGYDIAASEKTVMKPDPDWSATVKVGRSRSSGVIYVSHAERWRVEIHKLKQLMLDTAMTDGHGVVISVPKEPAAAGKGLAEDLVALLAAFPVFADPPTGDKMVRALPVAGQAGLMRVKLVRGDWNEPFLTELCGFPSGAHDDWVDALSAAYKRLVNNTMGLLDYYASLVGASETPAP